MKKLSLITLLLLIATSMSFAQITGSAHDFSDSTWNVSGEICITCHTPHNAIASPDSPLWNHELSTASYTMYTNATSSTFDATALDPDGSSKLCLSCHDGTVAVDNFGGATGGTHFVTGDLGIDLSNDHPISFTYDASLVTADGELADPTAVNSGLGGTIQADMLSGDKMQCSSCHDVHNAGVAMLLVKANSKSALCLTCHLK